MKEFGELFQRTVFVVCLTGLACICGWMALRAALTGGRKVWRKFCRLGPVAAIFVLVALGQVVEVGAEKTNLLNRILQPVVMRLMPQPSVTNAPERVENWYRRGAWDDTVPFRFDEDWVFPYGTNHLTGVEIYSRGELWPDAKSTNVVAALPVPLALVPNDTEVFTERTPSNTYAFTWLRGHPNRLADATMDGRIELFRNGDWSIATNGILEYHERVLPFAHDGYGQDDEWVMANFTNAAEILSVGYANWVDAQVGTGLTNGLYKFTVTFTNTPPEAVKLTVGDYVVAVTNEGAYVFLCKKGVEYQYGTNPFSSNYVYTASDDILSRTVGHLQNRLLSAGGLSGWTRVGGWYVDEERPMHLGYFLHMPPFHGEEDIGHLGPGSFPVTFRAVFDEFLWCDNVSYAWSADDDRIVFSSPSSSETEVTVTVMPDWDRATITVTAFVGLRSFSSVLHMTYGREDHPVARLSLSAPELVFIDTGTSSERVYKVEALLCCPIDTNGTLTLSHNGNTTPGFFSDQSCSTPVTLNPVQVSTDENYTTDGCEVFFTAGTIGSGSFTARCTMPDGTVLEKTVSYTAIEPLCELVNNTMTAGGYVFNPSRIVCGSIAQLKVGVNGSFAPGDVEWTVTGQGRVMSTDGLTAIVAATESSGLVEVEAKFGNDSECQPHFSIPILSGTTRTALHVFIICKTDGTQAVGDGFVDAMLPDVNKIYKQVGMEFYVADVSYVTNNAWYCPPYDTDKVQTCHRMQSYASGTGGLEIYCISEFADAANERVIGFNSSNGLVSDGMTLKATASAAVLAHEIGHACGLDDIYVRRASAAGEIVSVEGSCLRRDWMPNDWSSGMYPSTWHQGSVINRLLMRGEFAVSNRDIPSGRIWGVGHDRRTRLIKVGVNDINRHPMHH